MKNTDISCEEGSDDKEKGVQICENSSVFPSLPMAIHWLRESVRKNHSGRFQVVYASHFYCAFRLIGCLPFVICVNLRLF